MVDIEPVLELNMVSLHEMKENPSLRECRFCNGPAAVRSTVEAAHFDEVLAMAGVSRDD